MKPVSRVRRAPIQVCSLLFLLVLVGCQQAPGTSAGAEPAFASTVHTGDPKIAAQLRSGFHGIEQNAWRWTAQEFSVKLHPPAGSAQTGAVLKVALTVPDIVIRNLKTISLGAAIGGVSLPAETFSRPGAFIYQREVRPDLLAADVVEVGFRLDKSLPPAGGESRRLGIVVSSVGLEHR